MVLMSLNNMSPTLTPSHKQQLLQLGGESIKKGLCGETLAVRAADFPEPLRALRATFVTLHIEAQLRGCIGTLEARRTLVEDVAGNAWSAAFRDPRFSALTWPEYERLEVPISVLSPPEPAE